MYGNRIEPPARKNNRMKNFDYSSEGKYFVTICTKDREFLFWNSFVGADIIRPHNFCDLYTEFGKNVDMAINNISKIYDNVFVDKYCIMPNHVHLIVMLSNNMNGRIISAPTISTVIGQMKRWASAKSGFPLWQKSFHDHIIRSELEYKKISEYIDNNPLKWELDCYYINDKGVDGNVEEN